MGNEISLQNTRRQHIKAVAGTHTPRMRSKRHNNRKREYPQGSHTPTAVMSAEHGPEQGCAVSERAFVAASPGRVSRPEEEVLGATPVGQGVFPRHGWECDGGHDKTIYLKPRNDGKGFIQNRRLSFSHDSACLQQEVFQKDLSFNPAFSRPHLCGNPPTLVGGV